MQTPVQTSGFAPAVLFYGVVSDPHEEAAMQAVGISKSSELGAEVSKDCADGFEAFDKGETRP